MYLRCKLPWSRTGLVGDAQKPQPHMRKRGAGAGYTEILVQKGGD